MPIIGQQIGANVNSLHASVPALVIGIVVSLYGALGITQALFSTMMSQMWAVAVAECLVPLGLRVRAVARRPRRDRGPGGTHQTGPSPRTPTDRRQGEEGPTR